MNIERLLSELEIVAYRGAENASESLSTLLGQPVTLSVTKLREVNIADFCDIMGTDTELVAGLLTRTEGDIIGNAFLLFSEQAAATLISILGGVAVTPSSEMFGELEQSILEETTNITISSFTNSLASHLNKICIPGPPQYAYDLEGALMSAILMECAAESDEIFLFSSQLVCMGKNIDISLGFLPITESLKLIEEGLVKDE